MSEHKMIVRKVRYPWWKGGRWASECPKHGTLYCVDWAQAMMESRLHMEAFHDE